jgi:nucleoside-diphosphate-sugar epimerase
MLLKEGHSVTILDNFRFKQSSLLDVCSSPKLKIVVGDVQNKSLLEKLVVSNDLIIPLAAIVGAPACEIEPEISVNINRGQIETIAKKISSDQKIIFPVTNSGYGIGKKNVYCDENSPLNPISLYGKTKVEAEKILLSDTNAITLRLATVFGSSPRMRMDLLVNDFVYRAYRDKYIVLFESHFKRNYIHIQDVCAAVLHALKYYEEMKTQSYNVGLSSANLSKMELCERIKLQVPQLSIFEAEFSEDPDKRDYIVSNSKMESTGWIPKFSIDDGISELLRVYQFLRVNNLQNV